MRSITPHLWYDTQAVEAAELYVATFPGSAIAEQIVLHDTPGGDTPVVWFELFGRRFQAISAGPQYRFTPAISLLVACDGAAEVDAYWERLADGGTALMPLGSYPFSARYGWMQDRFGLSWQVMLTDTLPAQRITPMLMFTGEVAGKAEEAMRFYASVLPESAVGAIARHDAGAEAPGTVSYGELTLAGQRFAAMDGVGAHEFGFNEAVSLVVECDTQDEIDRYWSTLSAVPEAEVCGWLKDRYGVSWQVVPAVLDEMLREGTPEQAARVTEAFLAMTKFDLDSLQRAYTGR